MNYIHYSVNCEQLKNNISGLLQNNKKSSYHGVYPLQRTFITDFSMCSTFSDFREFLKNNNLKFKSDTIIYNYSLQLDRDKGEVSVKP